MARYTGPKTKIARRFNEPIFGADKSLDKKNYPPGQHGNSRRRSKQSEYAVQLLEKQFRNLYKKASSKTSVTGEILLQLCERRLDNAVYRMGISPTRSGARQLVSHRHITVNGGIVNIPSFSLRPGDVIEVREKSKALEAITDSVKSNSSAYEWLEFSSDSLKGTFVAVPERSQIPENIKEQLIVELYSK